MDVCGPAIALYELAIWLLFIVCVGQFLAIVALVMTTAKYKAKTELYDLRE